MFHFRELWHSFTRSHIWTQAVSCTSLTVNTVRILVIVRGYRTVSSSPVDYIHAVQTLLLHLSPSILDTSYWSHHELSLWGGFGSYTLVFLLSWRLPGSPGRAVLERKSFSVGAVVASTGPWSLMFANSFKPCPWLIRSRIFLLYLVIPGVSLALLILLASAYSFLSPHPCSW